MKELKNIKSFTKDQLSELDLYYNNNIEELLLYSNDLIINFIEECINKLNYSLTLSELEIKLSNDSIGSSYLLNEENLDEYKKIFELIKHFNIKDYELGYSLGDYYNDKNEKEIALYYYSNIFKKGFDLCNENYYYSLVRYLELLNKNPSKELLELINASDENKEYSLDYINTYLLLIINLEKFSDLYIKYIEEAIKKSLIMVRRYQKTNKNRTIFSDSDEERNLCELLALKMEYFVYHKKYKKAYSVYKQLTKEIAKSDCTRYYHARDKFYYEMIKMMSNNYPELNFFTNISFAKFKVINNSIISENNIITLQRENGLFFDFKIIDIYENNVTIAPILPLLGEGGFIYTTKYIDKDEIYLINQFDN